jgi:4-alpha-glucanotransferase
MAMSSVSWISIIPMQDILGLDSDARTNTPSTKTGNWEWRVSGNYIEGPLSRDLHDMTRLFGRTS